MSAGKHGRARRGTARPAWVCGIAAAGSLGLVGLAWTAPTAPASAPETATRRPAGKVDFTRHVRPILAQRCGGCHGPQRQMGGLRLDSRTALLAGGDSGEPAVRPGSSKDSRLVRMVTSGKKGERMPPDGSPLTPAQVRLLRAWIDQGAEWPETAPASAPASAPAVRTALTVTEQDRRWWAFRPLRAVPVPRVKDARWPRTDVDRFVLAALEKKGLVPARPANRQKLVRRLYFDLVGLPPSPEEVERFVRDPAPDAYEKLVDRLLASPQFGERWGRHWLDVARYADSNGQEGDQDRPTAYHYRDWVIRALNEDLPYDTFVRWQLAGDEYEPDNPQAVAATGFLTAGPHTVLNVPMEEEKVRNRLNELDDMLSTTGSAFLGMTIGCARCHDHKYDPIPTKDYYRMQAVLNAGDRAEVPLVPRAEAARRREELKRWEREHQAARKELETWLAERRKELEPRVRLAKVEALRIGADEKALLRDSAASPQARELAKKHARDLKMEDADFRPLLSTEQRTRWDRLAAAVKEIEARRPAPLPTALAMADFGPKPRETWLLDRGDLHHRRERVELGFLTVLTGAKAPAAYWEQARSRGTRDDTTYQRRAMADWITDTRDGAGALLARVIVNRLWQHHFDEGLVRTVNDFGLQGEKPSHPELLEWLASELVRGGWRLKRLHRMMVTSAAYLQGTASLQDAKLPKPGARGVPGADPRRVDPENRLLWRRQPRRIESEIFRDAMLAVSGTLNPQLYGPAFKPPIQPEAIQARNLKDPYPKDVKDSPATHRRTVYMFHKRVVQYPLMQAFDGPDAAASCGRRNVTTVAPQALAVLNEPFVRARAEDFARRLLSEAPGGPARQVDRAYRLALGRAPSPKELEATVRFVEEQTRRRAARGGPEAPDQAPLRALTDFAQVLFGLNEFMYVD